MDQRYICKRCKWIYDQDTPFTDQPDSFLCPKCNEARYNFLPFDTASKKYTKYLKQLKK